MTRAILIAMLALLTAPARAAGPQAVQQQAAPRTTEPAKGPDQTAPQAAPQVAPQEAETQPTEVRPLGEKQPCTAKPAGTAERSPCPAAPARPAKGKKTNRRQSSPPVVAASDEGPPRKVVRNGGAVEPTMDLAPEVSLQQASQQGKKASDLLNATEGNLKKISGRQLTATEQETVGQIKSYVEQAKAAAANGDVQRAYNLALKAKLLSADLAK